MPVTETGRATIYFDPELHRPLRRKTVETSRFVPGRVNKDAGEALAGDAENIAAFGKRGAESLIRYNEMVKRLKDDLTRVYEKNDSNVTTPSLQYDEMIHIGKDFSSREVVEAYDARHRRFRDIEGENEAIIAGVGLQKNHIIADFGSGTGTFVIQAAQKCEKVYAVDISPAMLEYTEWKARNLGLANIVCCHGGFLTYVHSDRPLDAVSTSMALHHLPDFWKQKALTRLQEMLKPNGKFFLADVVFTEENYESSIQAWINKLASEMGKEMAEDISRHIRCEHSTFSWIMEGLLQRAGFRIDLAEYTDGVLARYFCTKAA